MNLKTRIHKLEKLHKDKNKMNEIKVIKWANGTVIWENKIGNPYKSDLKP